MSRFLIKIPKVIQMLRFLIKIPKVIQMQVLQLTDKSLTTARRMEIMQEFNERQSEISSI